jgi:tryptophan-rich sensory protein
VEKRSWLKLSFFLLLTVGGGLLIGWLTLPGAWYASLNKPSFNPPNWIFGPVWTVLYGLIGCAGWRLWRDDVGPWPKRLWAAQLVLNFLWSPFFFGMHAIGVGLAIIMTLLATIVLLILTTWPRERIAALLLMPYAAWVAFATALNLALYRLN